MVLSVTFSFTVVVVVIIIIGFFFLFSLTAIVKKKNLLLEIDCGCCCCLLFKISFRFKIYLVVVVVVVVMYVRQNLINYTCIYFIIQYYKIRKIIDDVINFYQLNNLIFGFTCWTSEIRWRNHINHCYPLTI